MQSGVWILLLEKTIRKVRKNLYSRWEAVISTMEEFDTVFLS